MQADCIAKFQNNCALEWKIFNLQIIEKHPCFFEQIKN